MSKTKILISKDRIKKKVKQLARLISKDYKGRDLILVGILKGSFIFLSDLCRSLTVPVKIDFIQVSSYGKKMWSSGVVRIKKDIDIDIRGKHVLIVEDIIDYGYTLKYLFKFLKSKKPASIKVCVLLNKTSRRKVDVELAYAGFEVPDKFMVGYGLDFADKFRNLPDVRSIDQ